MLSPFKLSFSYQIGRIFRGRDEVFFPPFISDNRELEIQQSRNLSADDECDTLPAVFWGVIRSVSDTFTLKNLLVRRSQCKDS